MGRRGSIFALLLAGAVAGCSAPMQGAPVYSISPAPGRPSVIGVASWYGPGFDRHLTSSGTVYHQEAMTAASTIFPLGSSVRVTNLSNDRTVEVLINDHGPYVAGRELDLSHRAASLLGIVRPGTARVRMDVLYTPPGGPALGQRYFVQVGSFAERSNAERIVSSLARSYNDIKVIEAAVDGNRVYRVRMGAFIDRAAAQERASSLSAFGFRPLIISQ